MHSRQPILEHFGEIYERTSVGVRLNTILDFYSHPVSTSQRLVHPLALTKAVLDLAPSHVPIEPTVEDDVVGAGQCFSEFDGLWFV
jgi:hypothetical protein